MVGPVPDLGGHDRLHAERDPVQYLEDAPQARKWRCSYAIFAGLFPAVGVVIIMQGVVVGEKKSGTAAWVLSKPVTRPAFILSKVIANSLGVLVTMVVLPGIVAYT